MATWPAGLPGLCKLRDLVRAPLSNSVGLDPEVGDAMTRQRFTGRRADITGSFLLTRPEANTLEAFWEFDLKNGARRFVADDPMTLAAAEFIFASPPKFSRVGHRYVVEIALRSLS